MNQQVQTTIWEGSTWIASGINTHSLYTWKHRICCFSFARGLQTPWITSYIMNSPHLPSFTAPTICFVGSGDFEVNHMFIFLSWNAGSAMPAVQSLWNLEMQNAAWSLKVSASGSDRWLLEPPPPCPLDLRDACSEIQVLPTDLLAAFVLIGFLLSQMSVKHMHFQATRWWWYCNSISSLINIPIWIKH